MNIEDFGYCTYCGEVRTVRKNLDGHFRCEECGSTDIEEVGVCKICGQPIKPDEEYCEDCHDAMCKAWEKLVDTVIRLRKLHRFNGYIHLKGIPSAEQKLIMRAALK